MARLVRIDHPPKEFRMHLDYEVESFTRIHLYPISALGEFVVRGEADQALHRG